MTGLRLRPSDNSTVIMVKHWWNDIVEGQPKYSGEKIFPPSLSTINVTLTGPGPIED